MDSTVNFAIATISNSPGTAGTTLEVTTGLGARFAATPPYNCVIRPPTELPTPQNAEVVRVTARTADALTITRAQEGSTARNIKAGDVIYAGITAKTITDLEAQGFVVDGGNPLTTPAETSLRIDFGAPTGSFGTLKFRRGYSTGSGLSPKWSGNEVLEQGELGIERDTGIGRLGDGIKKWSELPPWGPTSAGYSTSEADARFLHSEAAGPPVLIKGTPAANKAVVALSANTAEWKPAGLSESEADAKYLQITGAALTLSGTRTVGYVPTVTSAGTLAFEEAGMNTGAVEAITTKLQVISVVSTANAKVNAEPNRTYIVTATGVEIKLGEPTPGDFITVVNLAGPVKVKGKIDGASEVVVELTLAGETRGFLYESLHNWYTVWGYKSLASLDARYVQSIPAAGFELTPSAADKRALIIKNQTAQTEAVEVHLAEGGAVISQREPSGALLFKNPTGTAVLKALKSSGQANPATQINNDGSLEFGPGSAALDVRVARARAGRITVPEVEATPGGTGPTGLASGAFVGVITGEAAPTGGSIEYKVGDWAVDRNNGTVWVCTTAGVPGTWINTGATDVYSELGGVKGQSFDLPTASAKAPLVNGIILLAKVPIRAPKTKLSKIYINIVTAGEALKAGENFAAILSSTGALLGKTTDRSTQWASGVGGSGATIMALESATAAIGGGSTFVWVALLANATTKPPELSCSNFSAGGAHLQDINLATNNETLRAGRAEGTAHTTIAAITPANNKQKENDPMFWAGVA